MPLQGGELPLVAPSSGGGPDSERETLPDPIGSSRRPSAAYIEIFVHLVVCGHDDGSPDLGRNENGGARQTMSIGKTSRFRSESNDGGNSATGQ